MRTHRPVALVAMVVVLAACGGSCDGGDSASDAPTTAATTATTEPPPAAETPEDTDGESTEPEVQALEADHWIGDGPPPEGVDDQFSLAGFPSLLGVCAVAVDGQGSRLVVLDVPEDLEVRLNLGRLETLLNFPTATILDLPNLGLLLATTTTTTTAAPTATLRTLPPITITPRIVLPPSVTFQTFAPLPLPTPTVVTVAPPPPATTGEIEQLADGVICGSGWTAESFVQLTITGPDGEAVAEQFTEVRENGSLWAIWSPTPEDGVGEFTVTANDGRFETSGSVSVVPATERTVVVLGEPFGVAGDVFEVGLAGMVPGGTLDIHAYRRGADDEVGRQLWDYVGTLSDIGLDEHGATIQEVPTRQGDPAGSYCLLADDMSFGIPYQCSNAGFVLGEE